MHMGDVIKFPAKQQPVWPDDEPPRARICWACGLNPRQGKTLYCLHCHASGEAQPWVECIGPDCRLVKKRTRPGQKYFRCQEHQITGAGA